MLSSAESALVIHRGKAKIKAFDATIRVQTLKNRLYLPSVVHCMCVRAYKGTHLDQWGAVQGVSGAASDNLVIEPATVTSYHQFTAPYLNLQSVHTVLFAFNVRLQTSRV